MEPSDLHRTEAAVLRMVQHFGVGRFVALITGSVVLAAVSLVTVVLLVEDGFAEREVWVSSLITTAVVPLLIAPPVTYLLARIVRHLDLASEALRRTAVTDGLTGILNRRGFFERVEGLRAGPEGLEVGMIDLDDFKTLNDRHGHATGDRALQVVAQWLRFRLGARGVVARLGGDEFAYVIPIGAAFDAPPSRQRFQVDGVVFEASVGRARCASAAAVELAMAVADDALYDLKRYDLERPRSARPTTAPASGPGGDQPSAFALA